METDNIVQFIITGGTIDSRYDGTKDTAVSNKESIIPEFIASLKLHQKIVFNTVCMKDSRDINEQDLKKILQVIEESESRLIIITYGTYTMADTAKYLQANLKRNDQIIVLTGSMIPINGFSPSDGPFNLGYSLSQVNILKPGVYVCMNGKTFTPDEVIKVINEGRFVSVFGEK